MSLLKQSIQQKFTSLNNPVLIPCVYVKPDYLCFRDELIGVKFKRKVSDASLKNLEKAYTKGALTTGSRKHIHEIVFNWYSALLAGWLNLEDRKDIKRRRLVFLTLTLPSEQQHSDKEIKRKCLNDFLTRMRYDYDNFYYLWVAETQDNGNIHFHLILDVYIDKDKVRKIWNECTETLGYVTEFEKKHGHRNPPSTFIEAVHDPEALKYYLTKYITKAQSVRKIDGRVWGCSKVLTELKALCLLIDNEVDNEITNYKQEVKPRLKFEEYYTLMDILNLHIFFSKCPRIKTEFKQYWFEQFVYMYGDGLRFYQGDYSVD